MKHTLSVTFAAFLAAGFFASIARAETVEVGCFTSKLKGNQVVCQGTGTVPVHTVEGTEYILVTVRAPASHCSDVSYVMKVPGANGVRSLFMGPGQEETLEINAQNLRAGVHTLKISAIGRVGGCNSGTMSGWAADVTYKLFPEP